VEKLVGCSLGEEIAPYYGRGSLTGAGTSFDQCHSSGRGNRYAIPYEDDAASKHQKQMRKHFSIIKGRKMVEIWAHKHTVITKVNNL
jgi:hypothetical protein